MSKKDYYKILGVAESASETEMKQAFRKLAKEYHPDRRPGDKQAEEKFKEINEAYEVLSDQQKRAQYDQFRKYGPANYGGGFQGGQPGGFDFGDLSDLFSRGRSRPGGRQQADDIWGYGGLGDIFGNIFGQGGHSAGSGDVRADVSVPFETAALGGKIQISIPVEDTCGHCQGSGAEPGSQVETCKHCRGRGSISVSQGSFAFSQPCPYCGGQGQVISKPCSVCHGQGEVNTEKKIMVSVPAGVDNGEKIRLQGLGQGGDLYLVVRVEPHNFFKRDGLDIYCEVPLDPEKIKDGVKIKVKTINGNKALVTIPPGTKAGAKFRLKGAGVHKGSSVGNQYVTIR
jgi:molecular chaperone DnaJ